MNILWEYDFYPLKAKDFLNRLLAPAKFRWIDKFFCEIARGKPFSDSSKFKKFKIWNSLELYSFQKLIARTHIYSTRKYLLNESLLFSGRKIQDENHILEINSSLWYDIPSLQPNKSQCRWVDSFNIWSTARSIELFLNLCFAEENLVLSNLKFKPVIDSKMLSL